MEKSLVRTSKFFSLVLQHKAQTLGLSLDENGWIEIEVLLGTMAIHGRRLSRDALDRVVKENDKQQVKVSDDGLKIRASQGHSVEVDLQLRPVEPPEELYHGTIKHNLASIWERGLNAGQRNHVHLSIDRQTAEQVGSRRGKPVILIVQAKRMHQAGFKFYLSANNVWLTDHVPAEYLS